MASNMVSIATSTHTASSSAMAVVAQLAPQRSTQYAELVHALAPHELNLSSLQSSLLDLHPLTLAGQSFLRLELSQPLTSAQLRELGSLATCSAFFEYHDSLAGQAGPFLKPLETGFAPALPPDLIMTRRYRGKTNELFTHWLCNIAKFSSDLAARPWHELRVFDPLAGGGTTLLTALVLGAHAAGVEQSAQDAKSTASFLAQYLQEARISHRKTDERIKRLGQRWKFEIGQKGSAEIQQCVITQGDTTQSVPLLDGFKPHLIVTDLPYGIQHSGQLSSLLNDALPVWASLLAPAGALAFSWDATRFGRDEMVALVESAAALRVRNHPPYTAFGHRVDRVIKQRDVIVAHRK